MSHVFVSYCREDEKKIIRLCRDLRKIGLSIWLDRDSIDPGANWKDAIRNAISGGSYFMACFSKAYEAKNKSYMNEELTLAIEELRQRSHKARWFIPILMDECSVPARSIGAGATLHDLQWINMKGKRSDGIQKILIATNHHEIHDRKDLIDEFAYKYTTRLARFTGPSKNGSTLERVLDSMGISLSDDEGFIENARFYYVECVEGLRLKFGVLYDPLKLVST